MEMKPLTLSKITDVTGGVYHGDDALLNSCITGVARDNRQVENGNLFLCIPGTRVDGHDFAKSAYDNGAVCCICEHDLENASGPYIVVDSTLAAVKKIAAYYRNLFDIPFVGITGSVGKTSAKEMTAAVLGEKFNVLKTPENLNNELGVPLTILSLRQEHTAAVIEMGISDFGEMSRLAEIVRPDICVTTNIGYCHLEALGDLNGVLKAKSEVFSYMPETGISVVNGDDELLHSFDPGIKKLTYGLDPNCDVFAENIENNGTDGLSCVICTEDSRIPVKIPAFGSHMVLAALAAATVGKALDIDDASIASGIGKFVSVGSRANVRKTEYITIIDDCYNANPNSVTAAIVSLASLEGQRVAILGDMLELGRKSNDLHRAIGVLAGEKKIDRLICCGKNAEFIYKGLISTGLNIESWFFPMKDALLSVLPSLIKKGDAVLVKASHGMHFEEIVDELLKLK